ncbi:MAG: nucleotidyltransferase domain-containing protein [bacterium]
MTSDLRHLVDILIREVEPDSIILFGSRARGDNEERSDYDICVLKTGVPHRRSLAKQIYRLLYDTGMPVDIIVETPERFDQLKDNRFLVYKDIAKHGQVIYERQNSR